MDGFDGFDELDETVANPNFDRRAQSAFDNLNDATDFTWTGLAKAFARRYDLPDLEEFRSELDLAIQAMKDDWGIE
jgi:hypothetical protein